MYCGDTSTGPTQSILEAPKNVSISPCNTSNSVSWDEVSNAESYNLYWDNDPPVTTNDNKIENASSPYSHTNLTNGTTYYYAVSAVNAAGESPLSRQVSATPFYVYIEDTLAVRAILDSNGMFTSSVNELVLYSDSGRVVFLNLYNKGISKLPAEIGKLVKLEQLWLDNNKLDSIPPEIGSLVNLGVLYLDDNLLNSLPAEIGNLTALRILYLHGNNLTVLPSTIQNFKNIERLYLSSNNLTSLPSGIGSLSNLKLLELYNNNLTNLPSDIGGLSNLELLYLYNNSLTNLPTGIGGLSSLELLDLHNNTLSSLPVEIGNVTSLKWLRLDNNLLVTLPDSVIKLSPDQYLDLAYNKLDPDSLSDTVITWLNIYDSDWCRPLYISDALAVKAILDSNGLDTISYKEVSDSSNGRIITLNLGKRGLTVIPAEIGKLANLKYLYLDTNNLTELPSAFRNLTSMEVLKLCNNDLMSISRDLSKCVEIKELFLEYNQLITLPDSIVKINPSDACDFGYNRLHTDTLSDTVITWLNKYDPDWRQTQDTTYINSLNLNINPFEL